MVLGDSVEQISNLVVGVVGQLDEYILTFERLAGIAGWDKDAPGTIEFFKKGLPLGLYQACLMRETILKSMADWQKTARAETQRFKLILIGPGAKSSGPTQNTRHNRPRTRDPNVMDVDATTSFPFKKLSDEEHKQYMKEGRCFRCRQQGPHGQRVYTPTTQTTDTGESHRHQEGRGRRGPTLHPRSELFQSGHYHHRR